MYQLVHKDTGAYYNGVLVSLPESRDRLTPEYSFRIPCALPEYRIYGLIRDLLINKCYDILDELRIENLSAHGYLRIKQVRKELEEDLIIAKLKDVRS